MAKGKSRRITSIGGSALIEGIMMRGPRRTSVAVRTENGEIYSEDLKVTTISQKYPIFKKPLLRGVVGFIDSMRISFKALMLSADKAIEGIEVEETSKIDKWLEKTFGDKLMKGFMAIAAVLGVALAVLLFFILPTWLYNFLSSPFDTLKDNGMFRSVFEGIIKIILFLLYIIVCSRTRDMKRVFMYHGAEHKTIACYENEEELTIENVRKHTRFHPRCGTSFLVIMLLVGIIIGLFIRPSNPFLRSGIKILLLPLTMSLGYELIKICGKYDNRFTRIISAPGMWAQRITTKEPDDGMIEIAITAMNAVIPENGEDLVKTKSDSFDFVKIESDAIAAPDVAKSDNTSEPLAGTAAQATENDVQ